ncbi:MAG: YidC/Oxa1 family membrane protein insertase [Oscillospiraceae bacterium]|nr:YidC/Oxa1 family membrane protein insertase [Oscillospiraceae bacterium]
MFSFLYDIFGIPFGFLMRLIYNLVNNYGVAIIIFTLVTKIIFLPVSYKTQKSSARMQALNPKLEKLRKSYQNNPQKLQEEQMKLYQEEGVNPMGSCLPAVIQMVLIFGVLDVVYRPLTHILDFGKGVVADAVNIASGIIGGKGIQSNDLRRELITLEQFKNFPEKFSELGSEFTSEVTEFCNNFQLFGINLGATPEFRPEFWNAETISLFLIPVLAGAAQLLQTVYMQIHQKKKNPAMASMGCMTAYLYILPLFSVWFAFQVPAGVGFYWMLSSLFSFVINLALNCYFSDERIAVIVEKDRQKAKKYAEVNGGKKTFMQKMLEQQQAIEAEQQKQRQTIYDENGRKLSRNEINNYNRQKINDAREKMNEKYSDSDYVCTPEDELVIENARQRIAEKYGDTYEN